MHVCSSLLRADKIISHLKKLEFDWANYTLIIILIMPTFHPEHKMACYRFSARLQ
jgi:hypothetical protein